MPTLVETEGEGEGEGEGWVWALDLWAESSLSFPTLLTLLTFTTSDGSVLTCCFSNVTTQ